MTPRILWPSLVTALLLAAPAHSQKTDPTTAVKQTLARFLAFNQRKALQTPEAKALYAGEAKTWMAKEWGDLASPPDRVALITPALAVGRTVRRSPNGFAQDQYIYLKRDAREWKVAALRSFAVTGSIHSIVRNGGGAGGDDPYLSSMRLTIASDKELVSYWRDHRREFDRLRQLVLARKKDKVMMPEEQRIWKALGLRFIEPTPKGGVHFVAGAALESRVGYYYLPDNKPPRMDMDRFIWVEKLADRWYFYRCL